MKKIISTITFCLLQKLRGDTWKTIEMTKIPGGAEKSSGRILSVSPLFPPMWLGLLGLFDFGFLKNWDFSKWPKWAKIRDFWHCSRYFRLFHQYIDDFELQNHNFSQKSKFFRKMSQIFKNIGACGAKILGFFQFFPPKNLGFFKKSPPP